MRTNKEILASAHWHKAQGLMPLPLSSEEKARSFGDPSLSGIDTHAGIGGNDIATAQRYDAGLPLTEYGGRLARRIKRKILRGEMISPLIDEKAKAYVDFLKNGEIT